MARSLDHRRGNEDAESLPGPGGPERGLERGWLVDTTYFTAVAARTARGGRRDGATFPGAGVAARRPAMAGALEWAGRPARGDDRSGLLRTRRVWLAGGRNPRAGPVDSDDGVR